MIRVVTRSRLARLAAELDAARAQAREVRERADVAYGSHIREVFALTARAEAAEKDVETARLDALRHRVALEDAAAELAEVRVELAGMAKRLREASEMSADASMVLLLHYGRPHSIHPDRDAAYACAATLGASLSGWRSLGERPLAELPWVCVAFVYDAEGDHFRSVAVPVGDPSGGAR